MVRKAHAANLKSHVGAASKGQPKEATTSLRCHNVTDNSVFVEGIQNAGLKVVRRFENDPNQVLLVVQTQAAAQQIVKALHGCILEGQTIHIDILNAGTQFKYETGRLPKPKFIRRCVSHAFHVRAFKEDLAQGDHEYAIAMQKARTYIKAPEMATKRRKARRNLPKEEEKLVARGKSGSESDESKSLAEEIHKQDAGETRSHPRGERSQSQDTAREGERSYGSGMSTSTYSSAPDDMLSALLASLDEGKDAAKGFDTVDNLI